MVNKGFQNDGLIIGVVKAADKIKGEFIYNGPLEDIEHVNAGCGSCTTLHERYEEGGKTYIPFTYSDTHVSNAGTLQKYPGGVINVSKQVTVWFKDGKDLRVLKKDKSGKVLNPQKERFVLTYRVDVKI